MGCGPSKSNLETVDDSVHVMLAHDKKVAARKGQTATEGYKPRAEHPLLSQQQQQQAVSGASAAAVVPSGGENNSNGGVSR
jgi:hypothetical protein